MSNHARILSQSEFEQALETAKSSTYSNRDRLLLFLSHHGGMRVGEIASLRHSDVLTINHQVKDIIRLSKAVTKGRQARDVMVSPVLAKELASFYAQHTDLDLKQFVIVNRYNRPFSSNALSIHFLKLYDKAGLHDASSHSGRRGFITKLHHKGVPLRTIMELVGHRQMSTTQIYIDTDDAQKRNAVAMLE